MTKHIVATPLGTHTVDSLREASLAINIARIVNADDVIAKQTALRKSAAEAIAQSHGNGKHVVPGYGEVTISENNVYSDELILSRLTPWQFARKASSRVLDRKKVKANFPAIYAAAKERKGYRASARRTV